MKTRWILLLTAALAFLAGYLLRGGGSGHDHAEAPAAAAAEIWTCSMHPQIRQPGPGRCPLCGMDLIPAASPGGASDGPRELTLSPAAQALAEIATAPVERRFVARQVRMVGKIAYDRTRVRDVSVLTEGLVERLFVNYEGVPVRRGEHLADLYSPDVLAAAQELLVARGAGDGSPMQAAARRKLQLLGVGDDAIAEILRTGETPKTFTLHSPLDGVVTELGGNQGRWLMKGESLAEITDTSVVWALLDAYESDIGLLHYGQQVALTVEALPGRAFTGYLTFIPPQMDDMTRTVKIRLNVPNAEGLLRPGMFVRAVLNVTVAGEGAEIAPDLAGKWISPMHPEIVKDGPGACDICGMPLVPAESLGFLRADQAGARPPLVIPATAPLLTGRRAVVYVEQPDRPGTYEGRDVELGPRAGDVYVVNAGLREGERVVVYGAMKIDSAIQILGKTSMMTEAGEMGDGRSEPGGPVAEEDAPVLRAVLAAYLELADALADDALHPAHAAIARLREAAGGGDPDTWAALLDDAARLAGAADLLAIREAFEPLSNRIIHLARANAGVLEEAAFVVFCPMAFDDRGASWLQRTRDVRNPYFGEEMLTCGVVREEIR